MKQIILKRRGIQTVLANTLHKLCEVPIKETGSDFEDAKRFEEQMYVQIQIYDLESRQIYVGKENHTKVYILMSEEQSLGLQTWGHGWSCDPPCKTTVQG